MTSLASVEAEMHKRTVLVHQVPPFCTKKVIDDNLYYLLNMAQLDRTDVQSVTNPKQAPNYATKSIKVSMHPESQ